MIQMIKFATHILLSVFTGLEAGNFIIEVFITGTLEILKHLFNKHLTYYF